MLLKEDPWEGMENPVSPNFSTRTVDGRSTNQFMWVKDSHRNIGLALKFEEKIGARFIVPKLHNIEIAVQPDKKTLIIMLKEKTALRQFRIFCEDCVDTIKKKSITAPDDILEALVTVVNKWVELFDDNKKKKLSKTSEIGLIGELLIMKQVMMTAISPTDSLLSWTGPKRHEQDFSFNSNLIEVKCQLASKDKAFMISSLEQLDDISGQIFITHIGISPALVNSIGSFSLPSLVDEIINSFSGDKYTIETFLGYLELVGYQHNGDVIFDNYVENFMNVFKLTDNFPKLTRNNIHKAIEKCSYRINASMLRDWEIPKTQLIKEIIS